MSQQDVDVVRCFYTRYRGEYERFRRDPAGLFALLHPDVEWHPLTGAIVEGAPYRGYEGISRYFEDLAESWESSWVEGDRFVDAGDSVVVLGRIHGRGKASELEMESPAAWVWKVQDGLVTYMHVYLDRSEALEAAMSPTGRDPAERVRVGVDLFNRRELDLLVARVPPEFVHDMRPTGLPGMEVYRGPGEYRRFIDQWIEAFPDAAVEEEELEVAGEVVFGVFRQTTHGRASGVPVDFRYAAMVEYRDGVLRHSVLDTDIDRARARFRERTATYASRQAPDA